MNGSVFNPARKICKRSRQFSGCQASNPDNYFDGDDGTKKEDHTAELERLRSQLSAQKDRNFRLSESTQRLNKVAQKAESQLRNEIAQNQLLLATLEKTASDLKLERLVSQRMQDTMRRITAVSEPYATILQLQKQIHDEKALRSATEVERDREKQLGARMSQLDQTVTTLRNEKAELVDALMPLKHIAPQIDFTIPANVQTFLTSLISGYRAQFQSFQVERTKRLEAEAERDREKLAAKTTEEQNNSLDEELKKVRAWGQERDELTKRDVTRRDELELRLKQLETKLKGREEERRRSDAAIKHLQEKVDGALTKEFDTEEQKQSLKKALEGVEEKCQEMMKEQDRIRRERERLKKEAGDSRQAFLKMELERNEAMDKLKVTTERLNAIRNVVMVKLETAD
ncbi:hypothetical protein FRB94_012813 [Tulasnella sp. JGI-2019a]|nr:hypothetical protein FRB94_012813 [Tulasnella sp. JGI-2019a]